MSLIFGIVEIPDDLDTDILACSDLPLTTTGDEVRADDVVVKLINEEQLDVPKETTYVGLTDVGEAMVHSAV
ncbi:hypothetical protein H5410_061397 [Solanum commersonii]|uniref:Uncharacterized protein n=1 Tax=Solanum commersonii TaxID=4109 RepID=A0A9J5W8H8_SOLCO|nr:hypothetical protein H5410_061397 [Solanum commersonii]